MNVRSVLFPVEELSSALDLLIGQLGARLSLRDGDRYAEVEAEGHRLALLAGAEKIVGRAALSVRAENLDAALADLKAQGARLVEGPSEGPHETRAVLEGPGGLPLVVSAKRVGPRPRPRGATRLSGGTPRART